MMLLLALAAAACPFPVHKPTVIATKRALPSAAAQAIGDMAEKGDSFQVSDALPLGPHPSFSRFVSAQGRGCDLVISYEHGGIAHSWRTMHLRFQAGRWTPVSQ